MGLFGSRKNPEQWRKTAITVEILRITVRMAGKSIDEARSLEKKMAGMTLEEFVALGHHCEIVMQAPDGTYWMAYGKLEGKLAESVTDYNSKLRDAKSILGQHGIKGDRTIWDVVKEAIDSRRIGPYLHNGNPYRLSKFGACLGPTSSDGRPVWAIDNSLFGRKRGEPQDNALLAAMLWCALKECDVPDSLAEPYLEMMLRNFGGGGNKATSQ